MSKEWTKWVRDGSLLALAEMHDYTIVACRYEPESVPLVTSAEELVRMCLDDDDDPPYEYRVIVRGEVIEWCLEDPKQITIEDLGWS